MDYRNYTYLSPSEVNRVPHYPHPAVIHWRNGYPELHASLLLPAELKGMPDAMCTKAWAEGVMKGHGWL